MTTKKRGQGPCKVRRSGGGRRSKQKGDRREREVIQALRGAGMEADKVPRLGNTGPGRYTADVKVSLLGAERHLEVKGRRNTYRTLDKWLGDNFALVIIPDRQRRLVVMDWRGFIDFIEEAQQRYERDQYAKEGIISIAPTTPAVDPGAPISDPGGVGT